MSVEVSSSSISPKSVAAADGRQGVGKGKAGANQGAGDAAPGGFMALLAAFEAPETVTGLPTDVASELPDGLAVPAAVPDSPLATEVPWSELSMLLGQKMPVDASASSEMAASTSVGVGVSPMVAYPLTGEELGAQILPRAGALVPAEPANAGPALGGKSGVLARPFVSTDSQVPASGADTALAKALSSSALPDMAQQGQALPSRKSASADPQSLALANAAESRVLRPTAFMDLVAKDPTLSGALVSSGLSSDMLNVPGRPASRPLSGLAATGLEGSFAQHALTPGGSAEAANPTAGSAVTPESAVAEQVTYWVSQGIQNAQLKLDGFGAEPVEVNISLKGQEAQIDFRTDQPEIRHMLEGALTQLKETLAREGLVLSGVSVGSSGHEGAGAQDRRQQPHARQASVVADEAGSTVSLQRASPAAGRALDIFV